MDRNTRRIGRLLGGILALGVHVCVAQTGVFPDHPVTLVVPFAAGSPTDLVARQLSSELAPELKQSIIVENRPGGSGTIAGSYVARAHPDGYTLLLANIPAVVAPSIQKGLPYEGIRGFAPIATVLSVTLVLYAAHDTPATDLKQFVSLLRENPGKYSFGSSGIASPIHLVAELFAQETGVKAMHVPYKGGSEVVQGLLGGQITFGFVSMDTMQYVRSGKLKAYGVAALKRDPAVPDLPTLDEQGVKGFDKGVEYVVVAPKGIPDSVADRLNSAMNRVVQSESFAKKIAQIGGMRLSPPRTRQQAGAFIADQEAVWSNIVKRANIKLD